MRRRIFLTALFTMFIILAACNSGENDSVEENSTVDNEEPATEAREDDESEAEQEDHETEDEETDETDDQDGEKITETGIYNGQADPHTIEIETDDGPIAFQLTMEARDDVDALTVDGKVEYTYTEDGDQRTIEEIKPVE